MRRVITIALMGTLGAVACAKNPATGERQLSFVSKNQEISIGREAAEEVKQSIGVVANPALQKYVSDIGQRLASKSERPQLPWSFAVLDDPAVNAFALPGGPIFVTRGLVAHMENEAQLASVIGHEIGHITGKHAVERISKAQVAQLGLGVGMLLSEGVRQFGQMAGAGLSILFLKFSRDDEHEADELGLRYALRGAYDVREMPEVFATLEAVATAEGAGGGRLPEWLSTHPSPENRIEETRERIAKLDLSGTRMALDREEYLQAMQGMTYGPDPRQGFFRGARFFHPELKFSVDLPADWRRNNLAQAVTALSPAEDAAIQLTVAPQMSPEEALRTFGSQEGLRITGTVPNMVPHLPSASAVFAAQTEGGEVVGLVTFVSHGGKTYQLISFTPAPKAGAYEAVFRQAHSSFRSVSDPAILGVKAATIGLVRAGRAMTLAELYQERGAKVPIESIALLNQIKPDTRLAAGRLVKWVEGSPAGS